MNSSTNFRITKCLQRLNAIFDNKDFVIEQVENGADTIHIDTFLEFYPGIGLCGAVDLYSLSSTDIGSNGDFDLMEYLGRKFLLCHTSTFAGLTDIQPIPRIYDKNGKWKNKYRWKYVEFCINELKYVLENDEIIGY